MKNKEPRCKDCNSNMAYHAGWIDVNGEYRCINYLYCSHCDSIYNLDGDLILKTTRLILTSERS